MLSGHSDAIRAADGATTFRGLDQGVDRIASALSSLGIRKGDRVGVLMQNGLGFAEGILGIVRLGAVACPLNTRLSPAEIAAITIDSGMRLLISESFFADVAASALLSLPSLKSIEIEELRSVGAELPPPDGALDEPGSADFALLVYTSGTTGRPKGVVFTHDQLLWSSLTMIPTLDMRAGDVHLLPVPMFHVGGLSFIVHCLHLGITLSIPPRWDASAILNRIEMEQVAHFFAVPTMLTDLLSSSDFARERMRSVRWIMGGGAPVPVSLIQRFHDLGIPLLQTCGATETGGPGLVVDGTSALLKAGSVGRGFFHTDVRLVNEAGLLSHANEAGEIQLMGRHIASGYWNAPDLTAEVFGDDGWFRTGDIGVADDDGYITLIDRKRNKIITGGENVYPAEVEAALSDLPGIAEIAIVGLPDERLGEIVTAVVVYKSKSSTPSLEDLRIACDGVLARYKHPRRLVVRDALPRNATGKLLRGALLASISEEASSRHD
ncbi:AMP-binding protein [Rhizobium sp. ARZ01]|uniref:class I adenylate-forming enzyme family protein n=1 Tax=Rhizobium sp. ARZ01 TaxID=2769313 RepID=UPI001FEDE0E8|nr:AMP-binding protein [Rhizobium sp. ARZ01]